MATITEDYVSFETAKLLKEKGFNEKCRAYYKLFPENRVAALYHDSVLRAFSENDPNTILCPTLQMAMKWLREVHKSYIIDGVKVFNSGSGKISGFAPHIWYKPERNQGICCYWPDIPGDEHVFDSYEESCEAAIKYCLENLI